MKEFKEFLNEVGTWLDDPTEDLDKYLTGTRVRIFLLKPELIDKFYEDIVKLRRTIDEKLKQKPEAQA